MVSSVHFLQASLLLLVAFISSGNGKVIRCNKTARLMSVVITGQWDDWSRCAPCAKGDSKRIKQCLKEVPMLYNRECNTTDEAIAAAPCQESDGSYITAINGIGDLSPWTGWEKCTAPTCAGGEGEERQRKSCIKYENNCTFIEEVEQKKACNASKVLYFKVVSVNATREEGWRMATVEDVKKERKDANAMMKHYAETCKKVDKDGSPIGKWTIVSLKDGITLGGPAYSYNISSNISNCCAENLMVQTGVHLTPVLYEWTMYGDCSEMCAIGRKAKTRIVFKKGELVGNKCMNYNDSSEIGVTFPDTLNAWGEWSSCTNYPPGTCQYAAPRDRLRNRTTCVKNCSYLIQYEQDQQCNGGNETHKCYVYTSDEVAEKAKLGVSDKDYCQNTLGLLYTDRLDKSTAPGCGDCQCCEVKAKESITTNDKLVASLSTWGILVVVIAISGGQLWAKGSTSKKAIVNQKQNRKKSQGSSQGSPKSESEEVKSDEPGTSSGKTGKTRKKTDEEEDEIEMETTPATARLLDPVAEEC